MVKVFSTICGNYPVDGYVQYHLQHLPELQNIDTPEQADVIFLIWTWRQNFEADLNMIERVRRSGKPVAVFDYLECREDTTFFMTRPSNWTAALEPYSPLARLEPAIRVYFKREYQKEHVPGDFAFPVCVTDFIAAHYPDYDKPDTEQAFNDRPIDLFMSWGYSSVDRGLLHAELSRRYFHCMATTLQDIEYFVETERKHVIALLYTPHFRRYPIEQLLTWQNKSKLSISLRGASQKCFRHGEACINSIMALQTPTVEFAYPWVHRVNCILLPNLPQPTINPRCYLDVMAAAQQLSMELGSNLYAVYTAGVQQAQSYAAPAYAKNHWLPTLYATGVWPTPAPTAIPTGNQLPSP